MPECENCGGHVSSAWGRVFSDPKTGEVTSCIECTPKGHIDGGDLL